MRSVVLSNRIRHLSSVSLKVAIMGLVGGLTFGCSSDVTRFDRQLYAALPKAQPSAYDQALAANQTYPGDVDNMTTASVGGHTPRPLSAVTAQATPDHAGYATNAAQPQYQYNQPTYAPPANQISHDGYTPPAHLQPNYGQPNVPSRGTAGSRTALNQYQAPNPAYKPAPTYSSSVVKSALPKPMLSNPALPKSALPKPVFAKPAPIKAPVVPSVAAVKNHMVDQVQTHSVNAAKKAVAPVSNQVAAAAPIVAAASAVNGGWSKVGGTAISLRSGETLYNISKRYGVPVTEIMRANSITNVSELKVGQQIIIPTYVYSQNAPISAPDSHPETLAARSSTGLLGQPTKYMNVPYPTARPQYAGLSPTHEEDQSSKIRYKPKRSAAEPEGQVNPPDYSIVTGSISKSIQPMPSRLHGNVYTVQSGDTLSKISRNTGVSVMAIQRANNLSNYNIRIGQKLVIPSGSIGYQQKVSSVPIGVDPIVTGSTKKSLDNTPPAPKPYVKPTVDSSISTGSVDTTAPKRTGIDSLRWPVNGRVVSKFGKSNDGIDISVPEGTAVKAAENGVVIYSGDELAGFGNLILIRHADGLVTAYAHNKSNSVGKGANVKRGQTIAKSGRTGNTDTPKLHFEVRKNSKPVDPIKYLGG